MNKELIPLEWDNQRIMTTKTLAECYETEEIRIQQGFTRNISRFIEGKHFYRLKGDDLKEFKANYLKDSSLVQKTFFKEGLSSITLNIRRWFKIWILQEKV